MAGFFCKRRGQSVNQMCPRRSILLGRGNLAEPAALPGALIFDE